MNIGIDLGTYNSAAAVALGRGNVIMVESKYGQSRYGKNYPSFVFYDHNGNKQMVGGPAQTSLARNPELVIWGVKRLVGLSYALAKERGELKRFQYKVEEGPGGGILIKVGENVYTPSQILEDILREIKEDAENRNINPQLGGKIDSAVISVPAYFDGTRIGPIKEAAEKAGLGNVKTIAEPTAAALVYGLREARDSKILTFDIGAGTLDITIMLLLHEGNELIPGEICTSGNEALGGIDMDDLLISYIIKKYSLTGIESNPRSIAMLKEEIENAKIALSSRETVVLSLPNHQTADLLRSELETVLKPILEKCRGAIRVALNQANLGANQLDHILFVGGPTRMPCVRAMVRDELKKLGASRALLQEMDDWEQRGVNPMECVAMGASLKAGGFLAPDIQIDANGYGTMFSVSTPGLPDYFYSIIPAGSSYPLPPQVRGIKHSNPEALSVSIPLIKKLLKDDNGHMSYKYYHLGDYDCYIKSTGEDPLIDIAMELNADKDLITTFTHRQTHESVRFEKLDQLRGREISLQEQDDGSGIGGKGGGVIGGPVKKRKRDWTQEQMNSAKHVAQMLASDYADHSRNATVGQKKLELQELIRKTDNPNDASLVMNRIQELLNALVNAHDITATEFTDNLDKLKAIKNTGSNNNEY